MKTQKINKWKVIAIVFISLFVLETAFILWGTYLVAKEERMIMECYYEICEDYSDAYLEDKVCSCYNYDLWGENLVLAKQEYMG